MKRIVCLVVVLFCLFGLAVASQNGKGAAKKSTTKESVDCSLVDDTKLAASVREKFASTKTLKDAQINVTTQNGTVTLSGRVQKGVTKGLATRQANRVSCVKRVDNQITVEGGPAKTPK
jgi:osmotically-inducible protein OsmY